MKNPLQRVLIRFDAISENRFPIFEPEST